MLEWTSNLPDVKQVRLDIFDGDSVRQIDPTAKFSNIGAMQIAHKTGNVQAVATVIDQAGKVFVRRAGFTDAAAVNRDMAANAAVAPASTANIPKNSPAPRHRGKRRRR